MAKAKGKEKPAASTVPEEVEEATIDDVTIEPTPEPVKMDVEEETVDEEEPEEPEEAEELDEPEKDKEANDDGTPEAAVTPVTPAAEKVEEGDKKEAKGDEDEKTPKKKKLQRSKKRKRPAKAGASTSAADKADASDPEKKGLKKAEGMGLIFMCNAKTKEDCFKYKIFGLPESKKDLVAQIYKGMRLFLYDIDTKEMHGIYKAAGPGGYNIEPEAFNSAFPSQVRFHVLKECQPLSQEKFKPAIKANYFGRNKFNTQLSKEQVGDLCKVFSGDFKSPKEKPVTGTEKVVKSAGGRDRTGNSAGRDRSGKAPSSASRDRSTKAPYSAGRDRARRPPPRSYQRPAPYYPRGLSYPARDSYVEPLRQPVAQYPLVAPVPYGGYGPPEDYYYGAEPREPVEYRDPYVYREPAAYPASFREAGYPSSYPSSGAYAPPPQYRY